MPNRKRTITDRVAKDSHEHHVLAVAAARMSAQGMRQSAIAKVLERSQAEISRLLDFAEEKGWYNPTPQVYRDKINAAEWSDAECRFFYDESLRQRLSGWAPSHVHFDLRVFRMREKDFANHGYMRLLDLIGRARKIGVTWGHAISDMRDAIYKRRHQLNRINDPEFAVIPLCGDPTQLSHREKIRLSASNLAEDLHFCLTGNPSEGPVNLHGVPAYTPRHLTLSPDGRTRSLRQFIQGLPGYRYIFGVPARGGREGEPGLVEQIDGLITGTGIIEPHMNTVDDLLAIFIRERLLHEPELKLPQLKRCIYGDIGGVLIEREGLPREDQTLVEQLNECWVGMTKGLLKKVAAKGRRGGAPGVILIASEPSKAEMIKVLVTHGLVNQLLINQELASALKDL